MDNKQILETLPVAIELAGFGINRAVYLNGILLQPYPLKTLQEQAELPTFQWGYMGQHVDFLSFRLLSTWLPEELAGQLVEKFSECIISQLENNFKIRISLHDWFKVAFEDMLTPISATNAEERMSVYDYVVHEGNLKFEQAVDTSKLAGVIVAPKDENK